MIFEQDAGILHYDHIRKYTGWTGRLLGALSFAVKVEGENKEVFYVKMQDIVKELFGPNNRFSRSSLTILKNRVLEITDEDTRHPLSEKKLKELFSRFFADKANDPVHLQTETEIVQEMEKLKHELTDVPKIDYADKLSEVVNELKPGDFLMRKYHEDNGNIICEVQKFFHPPGLRESYKFSHIALYLGEINGKHWVAEAAWPRETDPEIRRVEIDDPRFELKAKNQYLIIRNKDADTAKETARLARKYTVKLLSKDQRISTLEEKVSAIRYSIFEASRSMWHSSKLGYFGKQRIFKFYADYKNKTPFEYLGQDRGLFCSHFSTTMLTIAELNTNPAFRDLLEKHPIPAKYDEKKKGLSLTMSKIWYSVRKGVWARWMALRYGGEIQKVVKTQLDALRTSPQAAVQYMVNNPQDFEVIGLISHQKDLEN